jgi:hypothetical protein
MKYIITLAFILFTSILSVSAQDAVDVIAEKSCNCLKNTDTKAAIKDIEVELGLCMIREAAPFEKELKKKYHIDLSKLDGNAGEELGKLIATKMLIKCPDQMTRLAAAASSDSKTDAPAAVTATSTMSGTITDIASNQFVVITVKDSKGPDQKFLWLEYFEGSELLKNGLADVKGKTVTITYTEGSYYNPAIKDYMKYKVISGLSIK